MNNAFDKILEMLEELQNYACFPTEWVNEEQSKIHSYYANKLTEILKLTEQCNNGWIPCSEKLPKLRQDVLVTVKYTGFMGMHGYWIKTGHMEAENDWWGDCTGGEVIAWMELPSIYRPKEK